VPSTCAQLNANCGPVTDPKCGGVVECGTCAAGETCGAAGPNLCGGGDACSGLCAQIPSCSGSTTTTLSGKVLDPAGVHPLYNALVYIPNTPSDPGLQPFPAGITCDVCGATAAGNPLVTAYTAPDGTFTLQGTPVGASLPLVVQLGRWRRQFTVDITTSCGANTVPAGMLTMPKNHTEGDIPRISILTGGFDPMECVLRKMGVDDSEFTNPGGAGHIQLYLAGQPNVPPDPFQGFPGCPANPYGYGATIDANTPDQTTLFGTTGGKPTMNQYDLVILACEGYEEDETGNWAALGAYTAAGGRVFTTDFAYDWMAHTDPTFGFLAGTNPAYANVADWEPGQNAQGSPQTGTIDLVSNPKGMAFEQWLQDVGVSAVGSGTVSLNPVFHNSNAVVAPTQQWLHWGASTPIHFTFNTPVGAASANQCGRVVYSDWHADVLNYPGNYPSCPISNTDQPPFLSHGMTFPSECDSNPMTPQEAILEFMLFDLTACVQPYTPLCTPTTCAAQHIACGPAGDGCGNLLMCGSCPSGETCGGGGAGKCGTGTCTPSTCVTQGLMCGETGDGCGNMLNCGSCPTGQVCGLAGPGKCGAPQ
jgi:hypothetical protein